MEDKFSDRNQLQAWINDLEKIVDKFEAESKVSIFDIRVGLAYLQKHLDKVKAEKQNDSTAT